MNSPDAAASPQNAVVSSDQDKQPRPDRLVVLPVHDSVLFPELVMPVTLSPDTPMAAIQQAVRDQQPIGLLLQRGGEQDNAASGADPSNPSNQSGQSGQPSQSAPGQAAAAGGTGSGGQSPRSNGTERAGQEAQARGNQGADATQSLHEVGTAANILRYVTGDDGRHHMVCQGVSRFRVREFEQGNTPTTMARVEWINEPTTDEDREVDARTYNLRQRAEQALQLLPQAPEGLGQAIRSIDSAALLADAVTGYLGLRPAQQQQVLETIELVPRLGKVQSFLDYRLDVLQLSQRIDKQTSERMNERQREAMLREQMHSIKRELGEEDNRSEEIDKLRASLDEAGMPDEAHEQTQRELSRLERIPEASPEHSMVRTYLELMAELPWSKLSDDKLDIDAAQSVLDEDHYGLDKVKRRILEHLAVHKLNPEGTSPILCFVGPPGVGKTSLGQSIARAMGREFARASLGGVHDESEIRGHRRTYIGALPGTIIDKLRRVGTRNPVFMLDEMDKLSASFHGDPAAALLEVLDPEQNDSFHDNYLGVPFDLSRVMFIGTANVLENIPGQLRDRMEVIELSGYTREEKMQIARNYLIAGRLEQAGLSASQCQISDDALRTLITDYTREVGLRNLEREIGAVTRHVARRVAQGETGARRIDVEDLHDILGPRRFENETAQRTSMPGVSTGLAWTPAGGDILFIEASRAAGKGRLTMTGQLGDVMQESGKAALSLVKSRAGELGIDAHGFEEHDIHLHVPAGAIRKDGPSAGLALYTALVSLLTDRTVRPDVAMTGEISLRGQVLPVGGIKEKALGAHQAGIKTVLLPERNRKDEEEIPDNVRGELDIQWVQYVDDAEQAALRPQDATPSVDE